MNSYKIIELLEKNYDENVEFQFIEIFYDDDENKIEINDDDEFEYAIKNYQYDYIVYIEILNDDVDVKKLIHELYELHDENEIDVEFDELNDEIVIKNKEWLKWMN